MANTNDINKQPITLYHTTIIHSMEDIMVLNQDQGRYYYLQLKEDFFDDDAIQYLEELEPNGKEYALFYLKLCLKSLKHNGILVRAVGKMIVPYTREKLAELTKTNVDTVVVALEILVKIGLVEILESGELYLPQVLQMVGSKSAKASALRMQRKRDKEKLQELQATVTQPSLIPSQNVTVTSQIVTETVTKSDAKSDERLEIEIEREKDKDKDIYTYTYSSLNPSKGTYDDDDKLAKTYREWEQNISTLSPKLAELIKDLFEEVGYYALHKGMDVAVRNNARNFKYIETVARNEANGKTFGKQSKPDNMQDTIARAKAALAEMQKRS